MRGLAGAIREYESRIAHYYKFVSREIRSQRITATADPKAIVERESSDLLAKLPDGFDLVVVDERGERWSSEALAAYLADLSMLGRPGAVFVIGGPLGLSESLRARASHVLSLSSFTLPHELARLVLVEQIYRAGTIQRGEPYHKRG